MLKEIKIENFALIDKLDIDLYNGLNCFTGETGSGKSIIIDAISFILGRRADKTFIRKNKDNSQIELTFFLEEKQKEKIKNILQSNQITLDDDVLIVNRNIYRDGNSINKINNVNVTLSILKEMSPFLIEIHGQNEYLDLKEDQHINIFDNFIKTKDNYRELDDYKKKYLEYKDIRNEIIELRKTTRTDENSSMYDFLIFQKEEIEKVNIKKDELEKIKKRFELLQSSQKISEYLNEFNNNLDGTENSIVSIFSAASSNFHEISDLDNEIKEISERITNIYYEIDDLSREIRDKIDNFSFDDQDYIEIENRNNIINFILKKYGGSYDSLQESYNEIKENLEKISTSSKKLKKYEEKSVEIQKELINLSENLSKKRKYYKSEFESEILKELSSIGMNNVSFKIDILKSKTYNSKGADKVIFMISFNKGEDLQPLSKVASGGELSRFSLALKSMGLYSTDKTMIFDEIDTGISGIASEKIGRKLKEISEKNQTLCITHQSQIVSFADKHYLVYKHEQDSKTVTKVKNLSEKERVIETAKMIDGNLYSENSLKFSEELIRKNSGKVEK